MPRLLPKFMLAIGLFLCLSVVANAQLVTPEWEVYGGVDYLHFNACALAQEINGTSSCTVPLGNGTSQSLTQNSYGWHGTLAENKGNWFGGVLDFSGDYANRTINVGTKSAPTNVRINGSVYPFLFGPRFYRRMGRLVLFGSPYIGGVHARLNIASVSAPGLIPISQTHWAYALGGGADYRLNDRISIRGQADWIRSHFPETLAQDYQNSFRLSGGIVLNITGNSTSSH